MTLQRRLLVLLLIGVPLIWGVSLVATIFHAREEIYELFDTEEVRLAQQVMAVLPLAGNGAPVASLHGDRGEADLETLAISVWIDGQRVAADREGGAIPYQPNAAGFTMPHLDGKRWRIYYLPSADGRRLVAVGQLMAERRTLLGGLIASQLIPWLLSLPLLLIAMTWAVRHALRPVRELAQQLEARRADDLSPLDDRAVPSELRPLIVSTNRLFARVQLVLEQERRLTADAAHELRTPLAALRAQWDAIRLAPDDAARSHALERIGVGLERLTRLVEQLLTLARADTASIAAHARPVDWRAVVEPAVSACLPLIESTSSEVEVEWPASGAPLPLRGDEALLATLVRNLLDNALRYSPPRSPIRLSVGNDALTVQDCGPGLDLRIRSKIGERFVRAPGASEPGSGLGISIVRRIAELHGLEVGFAERAGGGLQVTLRPVRASFSASTLSPA